jgi:serine/threonine protein kinase
LSGKVHFLIRQISACKVMRITRGPNAVSQDEIETELQNARKLKALRHRNIVSVLSFAADAPWRGTTASLIEMEKCKTDLDSYIRKLNLDCSQIRWRQYFDIMLDILSGVNFLHENHLIHRDIKAANSIPPTF